MTNSERIDYDVVVVGGGPAGLSAAIRLKQLAIKAGKECSVCLLEKGASIGAHILSGAVLDPVALNELFPDWQERGSPLTTPVRESHLLFLSQNQSFSLPTPPSLDNNGCFIISLGELCRWLAHQAEELGVDILPSFAATELLFHPSGGVAGVATGDKGLNKKRQPGSQYQSGVEIFASQTIFAEGCRGFLTQQLFDHFSLRRQCQSQCYGLGIKELWQVDGAVHQLGRVVHSLGWPLGWNHYGGGFLYHLSGNRVAVGLVVGLDYANPWFSPFGAFGRFKSHPAIRAVLTGGCRLAYGARTLAEGGLQALPQLTFPGGLLAGDGAGFLNAARMQGIHTAMKSGMIAAESVFSQLSKPGEEKTAPATCSDIFFRESWLWRELNLARNVRPAFRWGLPAGLLLTALDSFFLRGRVPWTLQLPEGGLHSPDSQPILSYDKPDGVVTFDLSSSLALAHISHKEDQPCHLHLKEDCGSVAETRYCPAGVYDLQDHRLTIHAANCLHCKSCDIMAANQNILWTPPEGGSGPNYGAM